MTDWVTRESGVTKPTHTANAIGDSTFTEFRNEFAEQLRKRGYVLRLWSAKAGAWEEEVAVRVATSPTVDLNIVCPNGNRLSHQREARQPAWLDQTCGKIAAAMKASSKQAVVFVGEASSIALHKRLETEHSRTQNTEHRTQKTLQNRTQNTAEHKTTRQNRTRQGVPGLRVPGLQFPCWMVDATSVIPKERRTTTYIHEASLASHNMAPKTPLKEKYNEKYPKMRSER